MVDNVGVNPGTDVGSIDVATDDILGIHHQNNAKPTGSGKNLGHELLNKELISRDDRDMLDILTMFCNCKR